MPRLRQPTAAKKEELFDSTKVKPPEPEEEDDPKELQLEAVADDQPEPEVVVEEPKKEEPKKDDASVALQRALEAIRRNEELQRDLEAAKLAAVENQKKILRAQRDTLDAEVLAIDKTIQEAQGNAERAMMQHQAAADAGDTATANKYLMEMVDAKASVKYFEHQKETLKEQRRELKKERQKAKEQRETQAQAQPQRPLTVDETVDSWKLPEAETKWLKARPEFVTDSAKRRMLFGASELARGKGFEPGDPRYLAEVEQTLGMSSQSREQPEQNRQSSIMSAPVSREVPSGGSGYRPQGKITLSRDQLEAAKVAGVTPAEYARQLAKLNEMKANGEYGDRR